MWWYRANLKICLLLFLILDFWHPKFNFGCRWFIKTNGAELNFGVKMWLMNCCSIKGRISEIMTRFPSVFVQMDLKRYCVQKGRVIKEMFELINLKSKTTQKNHLSKDGLILHITNSFRNWYIESYQYIADIFNTNVSKA